MPQLSWIDYVVIAVCLAGILKDPLFRLAGRIASGNPDKHSLHSEIHGILEATAKTAGSMAQIRDTVSASAKAAVSMITDDADKAVGILGQIRDMLESENKHRHSSLNMSDVAASAIIDLLKQQIAATVKMDERLFEFVNSTKRIMRAMEGGQDGDDEALIEEARELKSRAAEREVHLTLEEAIKRVRETSNYRRG